VVRFALVASSYRFPTSPDRLAIGLARNANSSRLRFRCRRSVYRVRPTLLVATADKFAGLPWRDDVGELFGLNHADGPPDLIIRTSCTSSRDPLARYRTLETAIDSLATRGGVRPK
jgi:hypothetical protein